MTMHLQRSKVSGIALTLGGLIAATCHLFSLESSAEPSHLAQCAFSAGPVHLLLFVSLIFLLLGWSGQHSLQSSDSVIEPAAFVCLFTGILCADFLHCILEFSVFPVLGSIVPYALPGIAEATYHSATLGGLICAGRYLMFLGCVATAWSIYQGRLLRRWTAAPFALSAALMGLEVFPQLAPAIQPASKPALYISMAILGILRVTRASATRESMAEAVADRRATCSGGR